VRCDIPIQSWCSHSGPPLSLTRHVKQKPRPTVPIEDCARERFLAVFGPSPVIAAHSLLPLAG
jgi:hypothetical protein